MNTETIDKHMAELLKETESHVLEIGEESMLECLLERRGLRSDEIKFSILENAIRSEKQLDFSQMEHYSKSDLKKRSNSLGSMPKCSKRRLTFSGFQDVKCAARKRRRVNSVALPTKFLLGGNITDPLNLKSLENEDVNRRLNALTPMSSPVSVSSSHTEIEVLIPPNIYDPLNLNTGENIHLLPSRTRKRKIKRQHSRQCIEDCATPEIGFEVTTETKYLLQIEEDNTELESFKDTKICLESSQVCNEPSATTLNSNISPYNCEQNIETSKDATKNSSSDADGAIVSIIPEIIPSQPIVVDKQSKSPNEDSLQNSSRKPRIQLSDMPETEFKKDKIVSPVVPQGSIFMLPRRSRFKSHRTQFWMRDILANVQFKESDEKYANGSYPFEYKCFDQESRLRLLNRDFFVDKEVLDIGCNTGCMAMNIAEHFGPSKVVGIDVCSEAVCRAEKHLQDHFNSEEDFPMSMAASYGALVKMVLPSRQSFSFPNNIRFHCANYVPDSEEALQIQQPEFDVILCLRVTKWIHLNYGDEGLKRSFKRIFSQLRYGGHLILESQPWKSYNKSAKLTPNMYVNYKSIRLKPDKFIPYLLSADVGFAAWKFLGHSSTASKGPKLPVFLLTKTEDTGMLDDMHHSNMVSPIVFNDIEWSGCPEEEESLSEWEKDTPVDCIENSSSFQREDDTNYEFYQDNQMFMESYVFSPENENSEDVNSISD